MEGYEYNNLFKAQGRSETWRAICRKLMKGVDLSKAELNERDVKFLKQEGLIPE
jgi:hypothetical protein